MLSIIIPVYNEENTIIKVIERVYKLKIKKEIIIIDDCSVDNSLQLLKKNIRNKKNCFLLQHKKNLGKGAAIKTGARLARGEYIIVQDADLELNPKDILMLYKFALINHFPVVYGSRFILKSPILSMSYLANLFLTKFTNLLYSADLTDMETCYKLLKRNIYKQLKINSNDFAFEAEITAKILKNKYSIYELPIAYKPRTYAEGKHVKWIDAVKTITALLKYRFVN